MNLIKKLSTFILIAALISASRLPVFGAVDKSVLNVIEDSADFMLKTIPDVEVGSVGGEWAIIGLARSEHPVPQSYFDDYYKKLEQYVKDHDGALHDKKYTEYSRIILALRAIGKDPSNVAGYNLLEPLGDFTKTTWQGINGPIFALISLDCGDFEMPKCSSAEIQATRQMYVTEILSRQLDDGGFSLSGNTAEADITGMALQALAKYQDLSSVKKATDRALECLSNMQDDHGGFSMWNDKTSESTAQVFMALCELGIDIDDKRFVKNGNTVLDDLLSYYEPTQGFRHTLDGSGVTGMSSEQCFYTLVNYQRIKSGKTSLYRMSDVSLSFQTSAPPTTVNKEPVAVQELTNSTQLPGLSGKIKDIQVMPIISDGKNEIFADIIGHENQAAIESLASRGIIVGIDDLTFAPEKHVTRAEFATLIVKALGLAPMDTNKFSDVSDEWFAPFVGTVTSYGIANGKSVNTFAPNDSITRQEAAVMVANAAKLCGINTDLSNDEIRDILAQFSDYIKSADWARNGLALCYKENILPQHVIDIEPNENINRGEISQMINQLLLAAKLID